MHNPPPIFIPLNRANLPPDNRHTYSVNCSWNGPIAQVGVRNRIPCCPHCGSPLFEDDGANWERTLAAYAIQKRDPNYPKFIKWLSTRGKCSPLRTDADFKALREEFDALPPV